MGTPQNKEAKMKAMDIRTAFLACASKRKRKHSELEPEVKTSKVLDVSLEEKGNDDCDIIVLSDEVISLKSDDLERTKANPGDENNVGNGITTDECSPSVCSEPEAEKDDTPDQSDSSNLGIQDVSAEVSSALNTSMSSANQDTAGASQSSMSETEQEGNSSSQNPVSGPDSAKLPNPPKRRRKMSTAEAKKKEESRAQKLKEKELKTAAKNEEKMKLKEKREEERQLKKEKRELEKKEKMRLKQEKREQEEMRRQQEREERKKKKEEEIRAKLELKAEEKKKKEEQKLKALEEKKKAEEEKMKEEEEKKRLQQEKDKKTKEAFQNFFVKSGFSITSPQAPSKEKAFRPFEVTKDMVLACIVPKAAQERFSKEELDKCLQNQGSSALYLELLKSGNYKSITHMKEKKKTDDADIIVLVNDTEESNLHLKAKLLQFCENIRPAYWGTWRKKSINIGPRCPFGKDEIFDYEVDSDEEWDEGGPGESLTGTEDEESEDDYEVDNEFFVPHGYLSAEEEGDDDEDDTVPTDPEELKSRLKMKEREFMSERKKKTVALQPIILGCFFEADNGSDIFKMESILNSYSAEILFDLESHLASNSTNSQALDAVGAENAEKLNPADVKSQNQNLRQLFPEEAMPHLIQLVHGNTNNRNFLAKEFQQFWLNHCGKLKNNSPDLELGKSWKISKSQSAKTIKNISSWVKRPDPSIKSYCWWVHENIRKKYDLNNMVVPNEWSYTLKKEEDAPPQPQIV